jgi:hypothetical protein
MRFLAKCQARRGSITLALLAAACAPAQTIPVESQFSLIDPNKYKDEQQKALARQLAVNDCKSKAMTAGATIEKTIASENRGIANQERAREKSAEMYSASFTTCMNNNGYIKN